MPKNEEKTITPEMIAEKINCNQCGYPDPTHCEHYAEIFNCCVTPSTSCSYRRNINSSK